MPQHDLDIANGSGAAVRADLNSALVALGSGMKGPNAPPAPQAGMIWVEDDNPSATRWTVRMYDGADWIPLGILDATANRFEVSSTATGLALIFAASAAAARSALGSTATGDALFTAASAAAARTTLGATVTGSALFTAADAAAARDTLDVPLRPTASIWSVTTTADNTAAVLPAGGTWAYAIFGINTSTGVWTLVNGGTVAAGGTTVGSATPGTRWLLLVWRVA